MVKETDKVSEKASEGEFGVQNFVKTYGIGLKLPDGNLVDLSNVDEGLALVLEYIIKELSEIRKSLG